MNFAELKRWQASACANLGCCNLVSGAATLLPGLKFELTRANGCPAAAVLLGPSRLLAAHEAIWCPNLQAFPQTAPPPCRTSRSPAARASSTSWASRPCLAAPATPPTPAARSAPPGSFGTTRAVSAVLFGLRGCHGDAVLQVWDNLGGRSAGPFARQARLEAYGICPCLLPAVVQHAEPGQDPRGDEEAAGGCLGTAGEGGGGIFPACCRPASRASGRRHARAAHWRARLALTARLGCRPGW